jgi:hypothetical protein
VSWEAVVVVLDSCGGGGGCGGSGLVETWGVVEVYLRFSLDLGSSGGQGLQDARTEALQGNWSRFSVGLSRRGPEGPISAMASITEPAG